MLFWLGSIEFDTPKGRFILTGASEVHASKRRRATEEETAHVWSYLETRLTSVSSNELQPLYELYQELTAEPFNGRSGEPHVTRVLDAIRTALWSKQLHFEIERPFDPLPEIEWEPPPLVPKRPAQTPSELWGRQDEPDQDVHFKVRLVDETEQSLADMTVTFNHDGHSESEVTSGAGATEYASTGTPSATVVIESLESLEKILIARWQEIRTPKILDGPDVSRLALHEADQETTLTHARPHTIQIVPELGCIYLELLDKSGRVSHVNCPYEIDGPEAFSGNTDENAQLKHEDVFPGTYTLSLTLDEETYTTPVEVLPSDAAEPQVRKLGVVPRSVLATVRGFVFEKNKAFLMPAAMESLKEVRSLVFSTVPNEILIVGHADTTADAKTNDPLSLSRADCAKAFLLGDVNAWLNMYTTSVGEKHRWGSREDGLMVGALPDFATKPKSEDAVRWYQRTRGLTVNGAAGPKTRKPLIEEYMALVGDPLTENSDFNSEITTHGCGENFPLDESGEDLDAAPENPKDDPMDRRVDFFFFDAEFGIQPPVPGKNSQAGSTEYPEWRESAEQVHDENIDLGTTNVSIWLLDVQGQLMSDVPYRMTIGRQKREGRSTAEGAAIEYDVKKVATCYLEWGDAPSTGATSSAAASFLYHKVVELPLNPKDDAAADTRLKNLGYSSGARSERLQFFANDYGKDTSDEDGLLTALVDAHDTGQPRSSSAA